MDPVQETDFSPQTAVATALVEPLPIQERTLTSAGSMIVFESVTKIYEPDVVALHDVRVGEIDRADPALPADGGVEQERRAALHAELEALQEAGIVGVEAEGAFGHCGHVPASVGDEERAVVLEDELGLIRDGRRGEDVVFAVDVGIGVVGQATATAVRASGRSPHSRPPYAPP